MSAGTDYQIAITLSQATADTLNQGGNRLYGFRVVIGPPQGKPVVWFATDNYGLSTRVQWTESYAVFTSRITTMDTRVSVENDYPAVPGDVLTVTSPAGTGTVAAGAPGGTIAVANTTSSTVFSCGISQLASDGTYAPLAVFPLLGFNETEMVPMEKVFLMFAPFTVDAGATIQESPTSGIFIDLTDAPVDGSGTVTRSVSFDIDRNWSDNEAPWATVLPPNTPLAPLLIGGQDPAPM